MLRADPNGVRPDSSSLVAKCLPTSNEIRQLYGVTEDLALWAPPLTNLCLNTRPHECYSPRLLEVLCRRF
jgi:hypothetical protein